jgi:hypothetical protein
MFLEKYMSLRLGLAYLVIVATVAFPAVAYVEYPAVFGSSPYPKLVVIAALGSFIASVLFSIEYKQRLLAIVPGGILAGVGAVLVCAAYFPRSPRSLSLQVAGLFLLVGAVPGFVLIWALRRLVKRKQRDGAT